MAASYNPVFDRGQFCSICHTHYKKLDKGKAWNPKKVYSTAEWNGFDLKDNTYLPIQTTAWSLYAVGILLFVRSTAADFIYFQF